MVDANGRTPLGASLKGGLDTLSLNQTVEFELYRRHVLPIDGYVYWVKDAAAPTLKIMGALHYNSDIKQEGDNTQPLTRIVFSSQEPVRDFTAIAPDTVYMAWFEGNQFAVSSLGAHFQQSNLWHYLGNSNFSEFANLVVNDISQVPTEQIISNSLPSWLAMNSYAPAYPVLIPFPPITLYPEFLSPLNLPAPYGTVNIVPDDTSAYATTPLLVSPDMSSDQLSHDRVIVTLYGATNRQARDFLAAVNQYTLDTARFGIVGLPAIVRDDQKAAMPELLLLAHKKRLIFEVSYLQDAQRDIARQLIEKVIIQVIGVDTFESTP